MYIARILYPVEVLGPGKRVGIWFCGCKHACKGCSNPELWSFSEEFNYSLDNIMNLIKIISKGNQIDGFTITGGEPLLQYHDLCLLTDELVKISEDILVYTGYTLNELADKELRNIAVLIDGKYIEELNNDSKIRGSSNQNICYINPSIENKYIKYLNNYTNKIQNFSTKEGVISVGIHKPNFIIDINSKIEEKGLEEK